MPPWADDMGNAQPRKRAAQKHQSEKETEPSHPHHHRQQEEQQQQQQQQQPPQAEGEDQPPRDQHQPRARARRESLVDMTAVTEAHGLVTDMLEDPQLPAHIVTGLRTLSSLLAPPAVPAASTSCCAPPRLHHRRSPGRRKGSLLLPPYFRTAASDNEEIPFTGERPSALPKLGKQRLRKNLPPSILRRMSTATWTTTTSATGMPTLEPEPLRKRSTSFRNLTLQSPPPNSAHDHEDQEQREDQKEEDRQFSPGLESLIASIPDGHPPPARGKRSYSTTAIPSGRPQRKNSRERKTVASLHPLTPHDVQCLISLHEVAICGNGIKDEDDEQGAGEQQEPTINEEEEEEDEELPPLPSFRRSTVMTSDYESSNDSPPSASSASEDVASRLLQSHVGVQTTAWTGGGPCVLCGRSALLTPSPLAVAPPLMVQQPTVDDDEEEEVEEIVRLPDATYDLPALANDPLLGLIDIWDFPIFDMERQAETLILSQICYRVFLATGLFESFKIPLTPFFAYFHELEKGYRDKPYHNRMHASDVLHGVYFLISQPIPGFIQVSSDSTDSPLHRTLSGREAQEKWPSSRQGTIDQIRAYIDDDDEDADDEEDDYENDYGEEKDVYGVIGANFPALEIMALYAAAAMHDYDHPGRTNAFLVATCSPQAILYNDRSVLENHHAAAAWSLFLSDSRYNWLKHLDQAEFKRFRFLVIECILATDLKRHFDIVTDFAAKMNDEESPLDWSNEADRLMVMWVAIKLADINGPCKCRQLHMQWTHRIAEEFYEQGDEERALGIPISPYMDRNRPQLAKLQVNFINHLVAPLFRTYAEGGLLPGVWVRITEDQIVAELSEEELDRQVDEAQPGRRKGAKRRKAVICQQTKNLQDNWDYWEEMKARDDEEEQRQAQASSQEERDSDP